MSPPAMVESLALGRRFGDRAAVADLSFQVDEGELFGLVGPDGAGKTTTLRMLAGVLRPTAGDALVDGISVRTDPERVKHRIAYMAQRFGLYADLTVAENIRFYADLYRVPAAERTARAQRLFEFSGLEPFRDRLAGKLSGGQKQKLGLFCALIHEPTVLLLDEPTFGVDPVSRRDLWLIVHEMVARGVTVVVSTAYMDEAERFDRLAFLDRGRMVVSGSPEELRRRPGRELLAVKVSAAEAAQAALRGQAGVYQVDRFGESLHIRVRNAAEDGPRLERLLARAGLAATEIRPIAPSMEDTFLHWTEELKST